MYARGVAGLKPRATAGAPVRLVRPGFGVVLQQKLLRVERAGGRFGSLVLAGGIEDHRAVGIAQVGVQHDVADVLQDLRVAHRGERFDAAIEIAFHQIGAADVHLVLTAILEPVDA